MNSDTTKRFCIGGAIDYIGCVYLTRPEDDDLIAALRQGNHCHINAGRQTGKTSLMVKAVDILSNEGHTCLDVELTVLGDTKSFSGFFQNLKQYITDTIPDIRIREIARKDVASSLTALLEDLAYHVLPDRKLFFFMDEFDRFRRLPPGDLVALLEAFKAFTHSQAKDKRLQQLVITTFSVRTPNELIMEYETEGIGAGFGKTIFLQPFQKETSVIAQLLEGFPMKNREDYGPVVERVLDLSGGQPFLTSLICQDIAHRADPEEQLARLELDLPKLSRSIVSNHIQGIQKQLMAYEKELYALADTYKKVFQSPLKTTMLREKNQAVASLENIGLIQTSDDGSIEIANPIYRGLCTPEWMSSVLDDYDTQSLGYARYLTLEHDKEKGKVAVIHTGGTFGMTPEGKTLKFPQKEDFSKLFKPFEMQLREVAHVEHFPLYTFDGINMTPVQWKGIIEEILRIDKSESYDGFVVTHGTDTMAYTASAVGFAMGPDLGKPIVFTGSQAPISIAHGDMAANLIRAVFVASQTEPEKVIREVTICFDDQVLRACQAEKTDDRLYSGFTSPAWPPLGIVTEEFLINKYALLSSNKDGGKNDNQGEVKRSLECKPYFADTILYINIVPGLKPVFFKKTIQKTNISIEDRLDGIVITTPGAGNIPSQSGYNFREFIGDAYDNDIPVLITSQVPINPYTSNFYEQATSAIHKGAIPAANLTSAAALAKFFWVIGDVNKEVEAGRRLNRMEEIKSRMREDYIGETGGGAR